MAWDACKHLLKMVIINAERECQRLEKKSNEPNITLLYEAGSRRFGVDYIETNSRDDAKKLPGPYDNESESRMPILKCPGCGKWSFKLYGICGGCKDSEDGKYHSAWKCDHCDYIEKTEKFQTQILNELGVDFGNVPKAKLGIRTITDEGIK